MTKATAPNARVCLVCQAPLPDDAQFCHRCGTGTPTDPGVPPRTASTGVHEVAQVTVALADRYKVERVLGEGGMATVYLAQDLKHHRQVAIKVMRPELAATLGADRFLREIEIAAQLNHPHILPLLDSGAVETRTATVLYYVMPYVTGETVRELLDRETQLSITDAVRLGREIAEGLAYAHERGIVHRDIKPANVLISGRHALVADFGIARAIGEEGEALTRTGLSVGTPHYMAPEQSSGEREVDHRADIYAVGALLYEMLTGEPPFTGPNARAIITRSITERPRPLSETRESVPPALEAAVMKALAKAPADRQTTAAELANELERAMEARTPPVGMPAAVLPPAEAPSALLTWGLFAVGSIAGLALAYAAVRRWAMPVWVTGFALLLVLIGAGVMLATSVMESRRRRGIATPGLASHFTWRKAATGGFLALGLWALVASALVLRGPGGSGEGGAVRLAVMPFENRGAPDDGYFVDGVADEVRGKLSQLAGFEVIARSSTDQYRETTKTPQEIGAELGVDYLLTATVRWARGTNGPGRVQVAPEVMDVRSGTVKWHDRFDREDGEVLQVQSAIASRVASALGVALSGEDADAVEDLPTDNLAAYDLYLKGRAEAASSAIPRSAVSYYEQAVALDDGFTEAWFRLVGALSTVYANGDRDPAVAARAAAAMSRLAALDPGGALYHGAMASYQGSVERDNARAALHIDSALQITPNDAVTIGRSGTMDIVLERYESGIEKLRRARALDPRAVQVARSLRNALLQIRRFDEAREVAEEVLALDSTAPGDWQNYALAHAADGDLEGARAVARRALRAAPPTGLVVQFAGINETLWLLDEPAQQILFRLTPSAFGDDRAWWAQSLATAHWVRGDRERARAYADSALPLSREQADRAPEDAQLRILYALMLAYTGQREAALSEGERALRMHGGDSTSVDVAYGRLQMARIHLALNQPEQALEQLERLPTNSIHTPAYLKMEPTFASLRNNPRFQRLGAGT